ncbi:caspase family protein [Bradyrhizobium sp. cf659]|uniref:caspase family protein n=1 Tax=Bradyrhizobium sp. cf659 TaxID=1761771 RepID=UPI0008F22DF9|nr:caspase family protein [Bradyrhizobium sp. cf659]SFJ98008.1 Caspase domain-containing protein [Bradyrhizobium sp. cf659]
MRLAGCVHTVILLLLCIGCSTAIGRERAAVVVGVGTYHPKTVNGKNLDGAGNDLALMQEVLAQYGFSRDDETVLIDEQASREAIVAAINQKLLTLDRGSIAVFYFSGHGSTVKGNDKVGAWENETIVPYDGRVAGEPIRDIRDVEIYGWLKQLDARGVRAVFIFDSCYSGGAARAGTALKMMPSAAENTRPPDTDSGHILRSDQITGATALTVLTASSAIEPAVVTKSASSGQWRSEFTARLHDVLVSSSSRPPATWSPVIDRVREQLKAGGDVAIQKPQLFGAGNAPVFGTNPFSNSIDAKRTSATSAVLVGAGLDLGVTVGSIYKLFGTGQVPWLAAEDFEAKAKVTSADHLTAVLTAMDGRELTSPVLKAVEFDYAMPKFRFKFDRSGVSGLGPLDQKAISEALKAFDGSARSDDPELTVAVSVVSGHLQLATSDGRPVGTPIELTNGTAVRDALKQRLANYARWLRLFAWKRSSRPPAIFTYQLAYGNGQDEKIIEGTAFRASDVPTGATVRLSVTNENVRTVNVDAILLRPDFGIEFCPLGLIQRNKRLPTEQTSVGSRPGVGAWKLIISDPSSQRLDFAFLGTDRNARTARGSLETELGDVWDDVSSISSRGISATGEWSIVDVPFKVAESAAIADPGPAGHCLNLAGTGASP